MAQHRTKEDKQHAQMQRAQKVKTYSLSDIGFSSQKISLSDKASQNEVFGIEMKYVQTDVLRTTISIVIIFALLGVGWYFLR